MNSLEILSSAWIIIFYFIAFCRGGGKFEVITVGYIKEIPSDDQMPPLEEHPAANTEEKRLELCRRGFTQIQNILQRLTSKKDVISKGTEIGKLKFYVLKYSGKFIVRSLPAYKCPIERDEIYIHVDSENKNANEPIFQVIVKKEIARSPLEKIEYQLLRVENIVQANSLDMMSMSMDRWGIPLNDPALDTDEFTDEQRLQICLKGMQTSPGLNIELSKDTTMSRNKFYKVKRFDLPSRRKEPIMEAFECPTAPRIYISVEGMRYWYLRSVGLLNVLIKITDEERLTIDPEKLRTISEKTVTEDFFLQIRNSNTNTEKNLFIDSEMQHKMCQAIFKNERLYHKLNLAKHETYIELKKNRTDLWTRYYKEEDSELISGKDIIIVSGPESMDIMVSENRQDKPEDLFVCLVEPTVGFTGSIEEYFFSKEYNVNNAKDSSKNYIAGRFVFKRDTNNKSVVLKSMIEEFTKHLETSNIELVYLERRKKQAAAKTSLDDRLCRLDHVGRSRLCKLVFNFLEIPVHELGCTLNPITFVSNDGEKEANGIRYSEWMIPCFEVSGSWGPSESYYLSQVFDKSNLSSSNDLFVFSREFQSTKVVLEEAYSDPRIGVFLTEK